jgi:hypothetical protein
MILNFYKREKKLDVFSKKVKSLLKGFFFLGVIQARTVLEMLTGS